MLGQISGALLWAVSWPSVVGVAGESAVMLLWRLFGPAEGPWIFRGPVEGLQIFRGPLEVLWRFWGPAEGLRMFPGSAEAPGEVLPAPWLLPGAPFSQKRAFGSSGSAPGGAEGFRGSPESRPKFWGPVDVPERFLGSQEAPRKFWGPADVLQRFLGAEEAPRKVPGPAEVLWRFWPGSDAPRDLRVAGGRSSSSADAGGLWPNTRWPVIAGGQVPFCGTRPGGDGWNTLNSQG